MYNYYPQQMPYAGGGFQNVQTPAMKGRPVSSLEEVRAAQIDFDGSLFVFPDVADKKIYTKQINLDGTASLKTYALVDPPKEPAPAFITKEELSTILSQYQLKENANDKKSNSTTSNSAAINF